MSLESWLVTERLLILAFAFAFGAIVGSFLNVVVYRLPRGESVVTPRSRCPACGTAIPGWRNIPIVSWLLLRGRCGACKAPIAFRYPMVEAITGVLWTACAARFGIGWPFALSVVLASSLVVVTFIDIDIWEIPDEITIPGTLVGMIASPWVFDRVWYDGAAGALLGGGILWFVRWFFMKLRGVEGMGLGDVKLLALLGACLGPRSVLPIVLVASTTGAVVGGLLLAIQRRSPEQPAPPPPPSGDDDWVPPPTAVPFGPFLALGGLAELLLGPLVRLWAPLI